MSGWVNTTANLNSSYTTGFPGDFAEDVGGAALGRGIGLNVSSAPNRTVDTSTTIVNQNGGSLSHDFDRGLVRYFGESVEVALGRQAISWGKATLFPVTDLWSRFSPYELDTTQKRGIDAARFLYYPDFSSQIDFVVADRGSVDDLSVALKYSRTIDKVDIYVGGGKFWRKAIGLAGIVVDATDVKLRAEGVMPWKINEKEFDLPRVTGGIEYLTSDWQLTGEYHFNGIGASSPDNYLSIAQTSPFQRGETYFLGRHYLGSSASYTGFDRFRMSLTGLANIVDPSGLIAPTAMYEISDNSDLSIGAYRGIGETPEFGTANAPATFRSEFGTYGSYYYVQFRGFF